MLEKEHRRDDPQPTGSDHERHLHPWRQDRAAPRVRPRGGQGRVRRAARRQPQTDSSYYVGFEAEGQQIGLIPPGGPQALTSPVTYWHVADIEAKLAEVTAAGATVQQATHDVGGGRLVATFTDPDGNVLGLLQDS